MNTENSTDSNPSAHVWNKSKPRRFQPHSVRLFGFEKQNPHGQYAYGAGRKARRD
jgi:phage terminase large subunit-like protein